MRILTITTLALALALAGCGIVEERKDAALRSIAAKAMLPIVKAQSHSPLSQGEYRSAGLVAPRARALQAPATEARAVSATEPAVAQEAAPAPRLDLPVHVAAIDRTLLTPAPAKRRRSLRVDSAWAWSMVSSAASGQSGKAVVEAVRCRSSQTREHLIGDAVTVIEPIATGAS